MKIKHVKVNVIDNQIECTHCGGFYKTLFKKPIESYFQLIRSFESDHKLCVKPRKAK